MFNKNKYVSQWSHKVVRLAKQYEKIRKTMERYMVAANIFEHKIESIMKDNGVNALQDIRGGVSVYKKCDTEYEYDVETIQKIMGEDFCKIVAVDPEKYAEAISDYPLIGKHRTKVSEITSLAISIKG